jgi:CheY-like chemotaxis protein
MSNGRARPLVLIVEDGAANRALPTRLLTRAGYASLGVADGSDRLRATLAIR